MATALQDVPYVLDSVAELAAGDTSRQGEIADANLLIDQGVGEVVVAFGHGADKDTDALLRGKCLDIVANAHKWSVKTQSYLAAVGRQVVSNRVLDHAKQFLVGVGGTNGQAM